MEQNENTLSVLKIAPGQHPQQVEIDNDLKALQQAVGGSIDAVYPFADPVAIICNDEGKLLGLPLNRPLWDGADVLAGPGFLAGCDNEGNLTSLPQSAMDFYKEKFRAFIIEI